jgi:DNA excision repair protein ERCC-3
LFHVQVSSHGGSRRQEAQRLGRILRKKRARPGAPGSPGEEFDAFFYTLVSTDTQEVFFTSKRQQFLIDQGYSYKVIPSLLESVGGGGDLLLGTREDQIDLLAAVLHVSEAEATADDFPEKLPETIKGDGAIQPKKTVGRRMAGSMAALSGALGIKYMEYSTKTGGGRGSTGAGRGVAGPSVRKGPSKLAKFRRT